MGVEGLKRPYSNGWKRGSLIELPRYGVTGSARQLFQSMLQVSDWKGRLHPNFYDLADISGLSRRTVSRLIPQLLAAGVLKITVHGQGRRPNWYEVSDLRSSAIYA